jgi:hypothetical protein
MVSVGFFFIVILNTTFFSHYRVSKHDLENKMSLNNLATIFGPTLLHPAIKDESKVSPTMKMMQGAQDVYIQAGVLFYFLDLVNSGKSIRKSSSLI